MASRGGAQQGVGAPVSLAAAQGGQPFDVIVIGGGINGAAIAAECARHALRVCLLEREDFGFGTTWRSTKLIHGGLRYLEHGDVRLVFESLRERGWLLRTRPHLVKPQRFILPMLPWTRRPGWQLRAGLATYDAMALGGGVPVHRHLDSAALGEVAPYLTPLATDAFTFYDARAHSAERLTLEMALVAAHRGATIANHAEVERILVTNGKVTGVEVRQNNTTIELAGRAIVNAAGPWVDAVVAVTGLESEPLLGVTRGSHIAVELDQPLPRDGIFSTAREDGRVFFAVPQDELLLIGTTDVRYDASPSDVRPTIEDIDYLLHEGAALLPGLGIEESRVRYAYAGLRPLQRVPGGPEAAISRSHAVIEHATLGGPAGLYSVVGGKLSTFRPLAREVAKTLAEGRPVRKPRFRLTTDEPDVPLPSPSARLGLYGPALPRVLAAGREVLCSVCGLLEGEVVHAVRFEYATTVSDVLLRRSGSGWTASRGLCCGDTVAKRMAKLLNWNEFETAREAAAFKRDVRFHLPTPAEVRAGAQEAARA